MDKFDDIWKNRFNEESMPDEDWNIPDAAVWDSIAPQVLPKKKRYRLFFWLSFGFLFLVATTLLIWESRNHVAKEELISESVLETSAVENTAAVKSPQIAKVENPENILVDAAQKTTVIGVQNQVKNDAVSAPNKSNQRVTEQGYNNINTGTPEGERIDFFENKSLLIPSLETTKEDTQRNLSSFSNPNLVMPTDGMNQKTIAAPMAVLPALEVVLGTAEWIHPILVSPTFELEELAPPTKGRLTLGAQAGAVFWQHRISDAYTSDLSPFDFNYQDAWGAQTNLTATLALHKKLDVFVGLQYEQVKTTSGHNSELTYQVSNEENPTQPFNEYVLSLATPYGASGATFSFNRSATLATDEVDLLVDFQSKHTIRNLSLPVGAVLYPLGKNQKFVPSVQLGLGVNYMVGISNQIKSIDTHHDAIQFSDSGASTLVSPDLSDWHFDARLGVGFSYELNRGLDLQLNYNWVRGLNPIFEFEAYSTLIDRHQISVGVMKNLF